LIHGYGEKCGVETMVVEIVAIAAGLKAAVSAVKSGMETADDISQIAGKINAVFSHRDALVKKFEAHEAEKQPSSMLSFFSKKTKKDADDPTVQAMNIVVERKILDSQLRNLRIMLNSKYGPATWDNIVKERDRIINRRKAQIKEQRETKNKEKEASRKKWKKIFKEIGKIAVLVAVVYSMYLWLMWAYHK
jgi:predicted nuclease with TOPRIM domain